jgi:hypothetical protein
MLPDYNVTFGRLLEILCIDGLCIFHIAVDFLIVLYKGLYGRGGGSSKYVKLLYVLATAGGVGGGKNGYIKLLYILAEHSIQNTETHVHKITNVPVFYSVLGLNDFDAGKSIARPIGRDVARIKIISSRAI